MKHKTFNHVLFFAWLFCFAQSTLMAQYNTRTTGIGMRGSFWALPEPDNHVAVTYPNSTHKIDVGGMGGSFYIMKRVNERLLAEMSFGGYGSVKGETDNWDYDNDHYYHHQHDCCADDDQENLDISAITPALFGMRFYPLPMWNRSGIQPYAAAGIGPYFISDISVRDDGFNGEVTSNWSTKAGGYLGCGVDIVMTSWLAFNVDARYHLVGFNPDNDYSNIEWGCGLQFMWGKWR